jgi:hypothetical protein
MTGFEEISTEFLLSYVELPALVKPISEQKNPETELLNISLNIIIYIYKSQPVNYVIWNDS